MLTCRVLSTETIVRHSPTHYSALLFISLESDIEIWAQEGDDSSSKSGDAEDLPPPLSAAEAEALQKKSEEDKKNKVLYVLIPALFTSNAI